MYFKLLMMLKYFFASTQYIEHSEPPKTVHLILYFNNYKPSYKQAKKYVSKKCKNVQLSVS